MKIKKKHTHWERFKIDTKYSWSRTLTYSYLSKAVLFPLRMKDPSSKGLCQQFYHLYNHYIKYIFKIQQNYNGKNTYYQGK